MMMLTPTRNPEPQAGDSRSPELGQAPTTRALLRSIVGRRSWLLDDVAGSLRDVSRTAQAALDFQTSVTKHPHRVAQTSTSSGTHARSQAPSNSKRKAMWSAGTAKRLSGSQWLRKRSPDFDRPQRRSTSNLLAAYLLRRKRPLEQRSPRASQASLQPPITTPRPWLLPLTGVLAMNWKKPRRMSIPSRRSGGPQLPSRHRLRHRRSWSSTPRRGGNRSPGRRRLVRAPRERPGAGSSLPRFRNFCV